MEDSDQKKEKIRVLLSAYDNIQSIWHELGPELQQLQEIKSVEVDYVLDLAERLAYTAHAPMGWKEGFPLINKFPPAPQADQMRQGKLAEAIYQNSSAQPVALASSAGKATSRTSVTDSQLEYLKNSIKLKMSEQMSRMDIDSNKDSSQRHDEPAQKTARRKQANIKFEVDSDSDS